MLIFICSGSPESKKTAHIKGNEKIISKSTGNKIYHDKGYLEKYMQGNVTIDQAFKQNNINKTYFNYFVKSDECNHYLKSVRYIEYTKLYFSI